MNARLGLGMLLLVSACGVDGADAPIDGDETTTDAIRNGDPDPPPTIRGR